MFHRKKDLAVPRKHKHHKGEDTTPAAREPVLAAIFTEKLNLTEDVLKKAPIVMGYGNRRFCIENYNNIIEYTKERVRIQTKTGRIHILGKNLMIAYYRDDGMCVIGEITAVEYH